MVPKWKPWSDVLEAEGKTVLVKFQVSDEHTHIEDAEILKNPFNGKAEYMLFDGEMLSDNCKPISWMEIPE